MSEQKMPPSILYILYNTASENSIDDSFVFQQIENKEGIPIGKLFFWVKGIWERDSREVILQAKKLYEDLMGVGSIEQQDNITIGPFQNIEEVRRYGYLLCQQLGSSMVKLFSIDDFNECFKLSTSKDELHRRLNNIADNLDNLDVQKSKNFFNKILSRN